MSAVEYQDVQCNGAKIRSRDKDDTPADYPEVTIWTKPP